MKIVSLLPAASEILCDLQMERPSIFLVLILLVALHFRRKGAGIA
ncbi:MAG: hypothetical protein ACJZ16_04745 [Methylophilaceae bacterium]